MNIARLEVPPVDAAHRLLRSALDALNATAAKLDDEHDTETCIELARQADAVRTAAMRFDRSLRAHFPPPPSAA